jgi:hypothetical protein
LTDYKNRVVMKEKVTIQSGTDFIKIPLEVDDGREVASLQIDGVSYHIERLRKETLLNEYKVDGDPDYQPQTDVEGYCYILAPFCE